MAQSYLNPLDPLKKYYQLLPSDDGRINLKYTICSVTFLGENFGLLGQILKHT